MSDQPTRTIIFEIPTEVNLSAEEREELARMFQNQVIDSKTEGIVVRAKPQTVEKEKPVLVQVKEVALPKEQVKYV